MTSIFKRKGRRGYALKFRDPRTFRERTKQFPTKAAAEEHADHVRERTRAADGLELDVPFNEHALRWITATETAVKPGTAQTYRSVTRTHLLPAFGHLSVRQITPKLVRELVVSLRGKLAKKTVSNVRSTLHACLQAAVEERVITTNPAAFQSRSKLMRLTTSPGEHRAKVKAFTTDQVRRFVAAAPESAPRHALMFRTMLATFLRPGEAIGLQPQDLEHAELRIRLERAITPQNLVAPCKTNEAGEWEYVDVPAPLVDELRSWDAAQAEDALARGEPRSRWLFPGRGGGFLDRKGVAAAFRRVLKAAELPSHFTPHALRHTGITQALLAGEPVQWVQRQARHSDIRMTVSRYGSWLPTGNRAAADRVYERLFGVAKMSPPHERRGGITAT